MVVDDNHDVADSAVMLLQHWKHEAVAVYSAADCLAIAREFRPDVILMDIGLPGKTGFEVAYELREICPDAKLVAITGYTEADIVRRAKDEGFCDFLLKPVETRALKDAVDTQCSAKPIS
jgi:FixJ family two-component response regulator